MLRTRILERADLHHRQYGFRQGKNTTDALEDLVEICKRTKQKIAIIILIDIASAFDELWWPHVLSCLGKMGCSGEVYRTVQDYFRDREIILVDGVNTHKREQERGCPQGSILGPTLWNIAFDGLIRQISTVEGCTPIAYADDLTVAVEGESMEKIEGVAQQCMREVYGWCARVKMRVAGAKTRCLVAKNIRRLTASPLPKIENP